MALETDNSAKGLESSLFFIITRKRPPFHLESSVLVDKSTLFMVR